MVDQKTPVMFARSRQLTMAFDSTQLRGMSAAERRTAVVILAMLQIEASARNTGGGDDER